MNNKDFTTIDVYADGQILLPNALAEQIALAFERQISERHAEIARVESLRRQPKANQKTRHKHAVFRKKSNAAVEVTQAVSHRPRTCLYDLDEVTAALRSIESTAPDEHTAKRMVAMGSGLVDRSPYSPLQTYADDYSAQLDRMESFFPNFSEVIEEIRICAAIAEKGDRTVRLDPILLSGSAGVGKSHFAQQLNSFFSSGMVIIRMENSQSNSPLAGSDAFWSNAQPGQVFQYLTKEKYANPLFFLDEIDKVSADKYDPLSPLYSLLEPATAKLFRDQCFPQIALDASRILWFATCNDPLLIPKPLLSRFRLFHIEKPTPEQSFQIAHNIVASVKRDAFGDGFDIGFTESAISKLCTLSPRRMRIAARGAIGRALIADRGYVASDDVRAEKDEVRKMGF
jgi:Holliday junction resolvasome RuvABC ATP-dependent DNA helicase subunit